MPPLGRLFTTDKNTDGGLRYVSAPGVVGLLCRNVSEFVGAAEVGFFFLAQNRRTALRTGNIGDGMGVYLDITALEVALGTRYAGQFSADEEYLLTSGVV